MNRVAGIGGTEFGLCNKLMGYRLFLCLQDFETRGNLNVYLERNRIQNYTRPRFFSLPIYCREAIIRLRRTGDVSHRDLSPPPNPRTGAQ